MKKRIFLIFAFMAMLTASAQAADVLKDIIVNHQPCVILNNGQIMPRFGIGTFNVPGDSVMADAISFALKSGYRHIDTAHAYGIERGVGRGMKESGVPREQIWLTSKLWPSEYGNATEAIDKMLARLGVDYIDLLYVHQPVGNWRSAWRAMEEAVRSGKVRALGISNFDAADTLYTAIMDFARIKPAVWQMECHPYAQRLKWRQKAAADHIQVESWFPLGGEMSHGALFRDPAIRKIAKAHHKTPAQIVLRWHIQEGLSAITGATRHDYIAENINIFDFELTPKEMKIMRSLNKEKRFFNMSLEDKQRIYPNVQMPD